MSTIKNSNESSFEMMDNKVTHPVYKKRPGTSGIRGQLYETKLLSLIYFTALHDDDIEEFYLATNVDDIGLFDDICLRAKVKGFDKPVVVFVQAKHRENDKLLTLNSKKDLVNYFDGYLKVKRAFQSNNEDNMLFEGAFSETECVFVMYTTAKEDGNTEPYEGSLAKILNNLIGTCNFGLQPSYSNEDVEVLSQLLLEEQLIILAQKMSKYMFESAKDQMMSDDHVLCYHVILAQNVFDISEIQPKGHRVARFKQDFFTQSERNLQIFKDALCSEILERRKVNILKVQGLLANFLSKHDDSEFLSKLLGSVILFKNGKLEFRDKTIPGHYNVQLDKVNDSQSTVRQAVELAVINCIPSLEFNVPATFGNKDLAIRGSDAKIVKRLDHLISKITELIENADPNNIVVIDESIGDGNLRLNGGIASAVGNVFVLDDNNNLFKFCENNESLGKIAKMFYDKLQNKIPNFQTYRFDVRVKIFPKLSFYRSKHDEIIIKDFFSKLVFYTNQGDENHVEEILKDEILHSQPYVNNVEIRSEAIYLQFHDDIQKWWMTPKEGTYLTKEGELYKHAVDVASQPLTDVMNMVQEIKSRDEIEVTQPNEDTGITPESTDPIHTVTRMILDIENIVYSVAAVIQRVYLVFVAFIFAMVFGYAIYKEVVNRDPR